ncbi:MAG: hypothetical protein EHM70_07520 [Chloroflexota bacterium]|nr:MAG: hypothetical protein EHM70_07520 [Chloroflexota bacterium]
MLERTDTNRLSPLTYILLGILLGGLAAAIPLGLFEDLRIIAALGAALAILAALVKLELGLMVLLFITYTRFSDVIIEFHGAPSVAKFYVGVLLFGLFLRWAAYGERPERLAQPLGLFTAYGLVGLGSIFFAVAPEETLLAASDFVKDAVIAITIVILVKRGATFRLAIWTLLAAGIFMGGIIAFQYFTGSFNNDFGGFAQAPILHIVEDVDSPRVSGPIGDPNFFAQIMLVLAPLALERLWNDRNLLLRVVAAAALILTSLAVILTFSRGGFLALAVALIAMLVYLRPRPAGLAITVLVLIIALQFVPPEYTSRLETLTELLPSSQTSTTTEPSFRGRTSELMVGWRMFTDHPVFGVGWGNFREYYLDYSRQIGLDPRLEQRNAHNLFLQVAAETGVVGLAIFLTIIAVSVVALYRGWRTLQRAGRTDLANMVAALGIGLAGYMLAGMFIHSAYPRFLWLLVGMAMAVPQVADTENW